MLPEEPKEAAGCGAPKPDAANPGAGAGAPNALVWLLVPKPLEPKPAVVSEAPKPGAGAAGAGTVAPNWKGVFDDDEF